MSQRVALLGCGGTIASLPNEAGTLVPVQSPRELVGEIPALRDIASELDIFQLMSKDSSDMTVADWQTVNGELAGLHSAFDAFVVIQGTDTMAYTATATAFALQGFRKPIVFTGAQLPMNHPETDAKDNLEHAVRVAVEASWEGVDETMIVFSKKVLRAARTVKISESNLDAFSSLRFPEIAHVVGEQVIFNPNAHKRNEDDSRDMRVRNDFDSHVVSLNVQPGLDPDILRAVAGSDKCAGIILKVLGIGNLPSLDSASLIPAIRETVEAGKPVILQSKFLGGTTKPETYEPGVKALEAGAGHAGGMTDVATEVKLMWLLGQGVTDPEVINRAMLASYVGEIA